jgi:hypothetical protein
MGLRRLKSRLSQHLLKLRKGVGVALGRCGQHDDAEASRLGRRNTIRIGHKLNNCDAPIAPQRSSHLFQKPNTIGEIEMMKKIRYQHQVSKKSLADGAASPACFSLMDKTLGRDIDGQSFSSSRNG